MVFDKLMKKVGLLGGREKKEAGSSESFARTSTISAPSQIESSSRSLKPSRPFLNRSSSAPAATGDSLAAEQSRLSVVVIPATLPPSSAAPAQTRPLCRPPAIIQCTTGPTELRSNLPKRVREPVRPKTARKSVDLRPSFGHGSPSFPTSASMPSLCEMAGSTSITVIPPSPPTAEIPNEVPLSGLGFEVNMPMATPMLEQECSFPPLLAALPSPSSEYGGDLYTPSPSLDVFTLPDYPTRRSVIDSCIPEETSSNGSPTSIRSRMDPESPVIMTVRLVRLPSRATLVTFNPKRPITLDLSSATRKPNHTRQQASLPPSMVAGSSKTPMSPNYARPLALGRVSPPSTPKVHAQSEQHRLEVDVEDMEEPKTPPPRGNPFQWVMDAEAAREREEALFNMGETAVGTAL